MPVIIHSVQKLLNTSGLKVPQYISQPVKGQLLHSWYARLLSTGLPGKLLVIYVHEPSLLTVVCSGKTIGKTWNECCNRLPPLLKKVGFSEAQINFEIGEMESYIVAKTSNKSMLGHINQIAYQLEWDKNASYGRSSQDEMENRMIEYLYGTGNKAAPYTTPRDYWKNFLAGC